MLSGPAPVLPLSPTCPEVDAPGPLGDWDDRGEHLDSAPVPHRWMLLVTLLTAGGALFAGYL